ncbi:hypothetical protein H0H93_006603, partial [Arthromyces matolae]
PYNLVGQIKETETVDDSPTSVFLQANEWKLGVTLQHVKDVFKDSKVFRLARIKMNENLAFPLDNMSTFAFGERTEALLLESLYSVRIHRYQKRKDRGFIDMLVKIYYPTEQFPSGGHMTLGFRGTLNSIGDTIELKGPIGHFTWLGNGMASLHGTPQCVRQVGMVCAGSGITPILQVLCGVFVETDNNNTDMWVLDVN